jgi:repressor LexA
MDFSTYELAKYLKTIRESLGYSIYDVNKLCKISPSYLSLMENGKRRPSPIILKKLSSIYHIDYNDLLRKAGFEDLIEYEKQSKNKIDKFGNSIVSIPLLGEVRAGYDYLAQENWEGTKEIKEELAKTGDFFALKIKGNSMFETLWENDIVAVKKQDFASDGDLAVVLINGDEATVKMIRVLDNGIKLIPLNRRIDPESQEPLYEDVFFSKEDIKTKPVKIIGIVKQIIERNF